MGRPELRLPVAALCVSLLGAWPLLGAAQVTYTDRPDGISCSFVDVGLGLPWPEGSPRWVDAKGVSGGPAAFANHRIDAGDSSRVRRIDVTPLVQAWWTGRARNEGFYVRHVAGNPVVFLTREFSDIALRPTLALTWADGRKKLLEASADVALDCSTYKGLGGMDSMLLAQHSALLVRFDLRAGPDAASPTQAQLWLTRAPQGLGAASSFDVLRLQLPFGEAEAPRTDGVASRFVRDVGIERDPAVVFADRFEGRRLAGGWTTDTQSSNKVVEMDAPNGFVSLDGSALRVTIDKGAQLGADLRFKFRKQLGSEPDDIHFRYYLRLSQSWNGAVEGGKLPGLAGTYGQAGWGGRGWDGNKGWSLRGSFGLPTPKDHPSPGRVLLGTYAYHGGSGNTYGEILPWTGGQAAGLIGVDRWVCIEQHVRLNTPGKDDGLLEVWIDGRPTLVRRDLRLRDNPGVRIEEVWLNIFHGGMQVAQAPMHAFIDNLVVARSYIGPMRP